MKLYFIRHGQCEANAANIICGRIDSPLSETGHKQAIEIGQAFLHAGIHAEEILYSPLLRAKETAMHIAKITGIPAREEPQLIEQDFGRYEGLYRLTTPEFNDAKSWFVTDYGNGESMLRLAQRIYNLLDEIKTDGRDVILVAHNGVARALHSYFFSMTNEEYASFGFPNCGWRKYEFSQ